MIDHVKCRIHGTRPGGLVTINVDGESAAKVKAFLVAEKKRKESKGVRDYELTLKVWRRSRSLQQNRLYWALVNILAYEAYHEFGFEETVHEEILNMYAPRVRGKIATVPKRSKDLNTTEFSLLIEGVFRELSVLGVRVEAAEEIGGYWAEWMTWRGTQAVDPLSDTYQSISDYVERQTFCEACLRYMGDRGTVAHIISRGAGGSDRLYNLMRLCDPCHLMLQHQKGWGALIERYPHIGWKYRQAHQKAGVSMIEETDRVDLVEMGG